MAKSFVGVFTFVVLGAQVRVATCVNDIVRRGPNARNTERSYSPHHSGQIENDVRSVVQWVQRPRDKKDVARKTESAPKAGRRDSLERSVEHENGTQSMRSVGQGAEAGVRREQGLLTLSGLKVLSAHPVLFNVSDKFLDGAWLVTMGLLATFLLTLFFLEHYCGGTDGDDRWQSHGAPRNLVANVFPGGDVLVAFATTVVLFTDRKAMTPCTSPDFGWSCNITQACLRCYMPVIISLYTRTSGSMFLRLNVYYKVLERSNTKLMFESISHWTTCAMMLVMYALAISHLLLYSSSDIRFVASTFAVPAFYLLWAFSGSVSINKLVLTLNEYNGPAVVKTVNEAHMCSCVVTATKEADLDEIIRAAADMNAAADWKDEIIPAPAEMKLFALLPTRQKNTINEMWPSSYAHMFQQGAAADDFERWWKAVRYVSWMTNLTMVLCLLLQIVHDGGDISTGYVEDVPSAVICSLCLVSVLWNSLWCVTGWPMICWSCVALTISYVSYCLAGVDDLFSPHVSVHASLLKVR